MNKATIIMHYNPNDIEEYLIDREFEVKLVEFINDLRRSAYIRVQLDEHK